MRVLIAPQSFKGSLDAIGVADAIAAGLRRVWPNDPYDILPVADGGEGTVEALVTATQGHFLESRVEDPLGRPVLARWGVLGDGQTAVIELAAASGLPLLARRERNPNITTTFGTGQLIREALDKGIGKIIVGIGGSATNDAGVGMAHALGARFLDDRGKYLPRGGRALQKLHHIDVSKLDPRLKNVQIVIASDVTNPLTGPQGAAAIYGPQKGASAEDVVALDKALLRFAEAARRDLDVDVAEIPGAGAAGGTGAGLMAFASATMCRGVDVVFEAMDFDSHVREADLVVTGEGRVDAQDVFGKAPVVVAQRAAARNIPVVMIVGSIADGYESVFDHGVSAVISIVTRPMNIERAVAMTGQLITQASEQAARLLETGRQLR